MNFADLARGKSLALERSQKVSAKRFIYPERQRSVTIFGRASSVCIIDYHVFKTNQMCLLDRSPVLDHKHKISFK
jgi:hypothetical protein